MATSQGAASLGRGARAYGGWRNRWNVWQRRSMVVAAVAHGVLFIAWPVWRVTYERPERPLEMIQILPIVAALGGLSTPEGAEAAPAPEKEVVELAAAEPEGVTIETDEELLELMGLIEALDGPRPTVVYPLLESDEPNRPDAPVEKPEMVLDLQAVDVQLAKSPDLLAWPLIRNPTAVVHFLRRSFNPIYQEPGPNGLVSVAMFVNEVGVVEWAAVQESSGYTKLDDIALAMVNDVALFRPVRGAGGRVPVTVVMEVPFMAPW